MTARCILEWLKAIGPLAVALAVFIATCWFYRWQIRLAKQKLRHELYDRRFAIYDAFRELLPTLIEKNDDEIVAAYRKASSARFEARFLLRNAKIQQILENLCKEVNDDVISNIMYRDAMKSQVMNDPQVMRDYSEKMDHLGKAKLIIADRYFEELPKQFERFLKLTDFWK